MKGLVVYGFPAIGKTTVCKKFDNFIDLESSDYHWLFTEEQLKMSVEERKGIDKVKNPAWPQNYFEAIDNARKKYDYIFVAFAGIEYCQKNDIKYMRIYPSIDQKNDYLKRMKNRGNSDDFLEKMAKNFEDYINGCIDDKRAIKIEMQKGEYLEDCLKRLNIIPNDENEMIK